jgi:hypothetical protein
MILRLGLVAGIVLASASLASAQPKIGDVRVGKIISGPAVSPSELSGKAVVIKMWGRH